MNTQVSGKANLPKKKFATQTPNQQAHKLLTSREAAAFLGFSERKLWALRKCGEIAFLKIGRSVRFQLNDLLLFIEKNRMGGGR